MASTVEKAHGRREKRTLRTTTLLTITQDWAGLGTEAADAERLQGLVRGHWAIENHLHYVRDVT